MAWAGPVSSIANAQIWSNFAQGRLHSLRCSEVAYLILSEEKSLQASALTDSKSEFTKGNQDFKHNSCIFIHFNSFTVSK